MGLSALAGYADFRPRLRVVVLVRTARAFGDCGGDAGNDPGIYGAFGNTFPANAEIDFTAGRGTADRDCGSRGAGEPLVESRRGTHRPGRRGGVADCVHDLVGSFSVYTQASAAAFEDDEFGSADAGGRGVAGGGSGSSRRISQFSSFQCIARSLVRAGLLDRCGLDHWVYCVCVADSSRIADQGGDLRVREPGGGGAGWLFPRGRGVGITNDRRQRVCVGQRGGDYDYTLGEGGS